MSAIDDLPPVSAMIEAAGLKARRSLGQNFLLDLNLTARIARAAGDLTRSTVVEIGPGPGGLTRALLACGAAKIIAIERDPRCIDILTTIATRYPGRLEIVEGDAMREAMEARLDGASACVVANLPYNIGTELLIGWLTAPAWPPWFTSLTLMFQREVAERIVATPAQRKSYGRLAVLAGWRTEPKILFNVPPSAFTPAPTVMSSVVQLVPRCAPLPCDVKMLEAVTAAAFGQRRKMLRQSLRALEGRHSLHSAADLIAMCGLDGTRRAEELDVRDFIDLANAASRTA